MTEELPADFVHFEDIEVGVARRLGPRTVTEAEIIDFALKYDPQPMHTDPIAARHSPVGRLIASGYHTAALMMRIMCDGFVLRSSSLGSSGIDECRWLKPVLPGDTLSVDVVSTAKRVLGSRPDVGICQMTYTTRNQAGEAVMEMLGSYFLRLRNPGKASTQAQPAREPSTSKAPIPQAPIDLWADHPAPLPPLPPSGLFVEDRVIGETAELGSYTFERDDIIAFARAFDPQRFHLDEAAGKASLFGGLSASGWQTAAVHLKLVITERDKRLAEAEARGMPTAQIGPSPGFRNLKWLQPVLAGDTISFRSRVIGSRPLASNPKRGLVTMLTQGRNQHGKIVFAVEGQVFADRRAST
jgi:acyl dehydratase